MLVTAVDVVYEPSDRSQLGKMMGKAEETLGLRAERTLADAGYHSGSSLEECAQRGQSVAMPESQDRVLESPYHKDGFAYDEAEDSYRCPEGQLLRFTRIKRTRNTMMRLYRGSGAMCRACPAFGVCTTDRVMGAPWRSAPTTLCCVVTGLGCAPKKPNEHIDGECHWSNLSSASSKSSSKPTGSCCAAYATWRLSGRCSPRPSTCALCGGYGEPLRLPRQGVGSSRKHPQPIERYRRLSRARPPPCFYS